MRGRSEVRARLGRHRRVAHARRARLHRARAGGERGGRAMPAPPPPPSQANLPHNWTELIDPKAGHRALFQPATKESSWTAPRGSPGLSESSAPPPPPSACYGGLAAVAAAACAADRVSAVASSSAPPPPPIDQLGCGARRGRDRRRVDRGDRPGVGSHVLVEPGHRRADVGGPDAHVAPGDARADGDEPGATEHSHRVAADADGRGELLGARRGLGGPAERLDPRED